MNGVQEIYIGYRIYKEYKKIPGTIRMTQRKR